MPKVIGQDKSAMRRFLESLRSLRPVQIFCGLSAFAVLVRLSLFVIEGPYFEGDTSMLVTRHLPAIRGCLSEGRLSGCPQSGSWPLFQNVVGLMLNYLGISASAILHALAYLSFLAFLGLILLVFRSLKKRSTPLAITAVVILITSPLLWYSHSTFGEMAAAFLTLAFTAACIVSKREWIVFLLFVLAGLTKEIAFPFLALIGLLCLLPEVASRQVKVRKRIGTLFLGAFLTLIINSAFNYFRFGLFYNPSYLNELFIVPSWRLRSSFFLAIWFSPSGGIFFFWTSFAFLYFSICAALILRRAKDGRSQHGGENSKANLVFYLPIITISLILFALTLGFSSWCCSPLGGAAWGPRFMIPWIPTVSLLLLHFYPHQALAVLALLLKRSYSFVLTCLTLLLVSIPQVAIFFGTFVLGDIFAPTPECPRLPVIQEGVSYYYRCLNNQFWPYKWSLLQSYMVAARPSALWVTVLYGITLIGACLLIRKYLFQRQANKVTSPKPFSKLQ
jgi:hypothetical protein